MSVAVNRGSTRAESARVNEFRVEQLDVGTTRGVHLENEYVHGYCISSAEPPFVPLPQPHAPSAGRLPGREGGGRLA